MNSTDKAGFATHILAIAEIYGKALSPAAIDIYWTALRGYPLTEVQCAFERHVQDAEAGRFFPKPADLIRQLQPRAGDDGHPDPDEAWGLLVRLIQDERETGVLTDELRAGWQACQPILDLGDEVGARRCFLTVYARQVEDARRHGQRARWTVTLGTCPQLRARRLAEAVQARRLSHDQVTSLLPGPAPASLDQVAGLLEGPDASAPEAKTAARLRALAALLRAGSAEADARRAAERQAQREREAERKRAVQNLLDGRGGDAAQDAA
jgi:hypothetical protein